MGLRARIKAFKKLDKRPSENLKMATELADKLHKHTRKCRSRANRKRFMWNKEGRDARATRLSTQHRTPGPDGH